ncbi:hypothetical protein K432DRAFT_426382 [Lepidopterella palustris CBS 459.81]|uniref:Uncharacterized protein n=1 Tax=Lepidopterella palustris CBS 459.81 TaxID=1314670 RepID=A0A8E2JEJ3_9PEZI|nr:hypothetical protein K432DRAFT_426382 [Lepidopterella palustris CBS 459.81]
MSKLRRQAPPGLILPVSNPSFPIALRRRENLDLDGNYIFHRPNIQSHPNSSKNGQFPVFRPPGGTPISRLPHALVPSIPISNPEEINEPLTMNLLRNNRQIYDEAIGELHRNNKSKLRYQYHQSVTAELAGFGTFAIANIRKLHAKPSCSRKEE